MKLVILGSKGMVGSMLLFLGKKKGLDVVGIDRSQFDVLRDPVEKLRDILGHQDDRVCLINCIGCIPQKQYEDSQYTQINEIFPHELATFCQSYSYGLLHISTNCVFEGTHDGYVETDPCDATDVYGKSKAHGEPSYGLTVRASIIGLEQKSASGLLAWFLTNPNSEIQGYLNQYWNGVTSLQLSHCIYDTFIEKAWTRDIFHVYSESTVSKYELLTMSKEVFQKDIQIIPFACPLKYYTLASIKTNPQKAIDQQLLDLSKIYDEFMTST
jgi:dTDP-4-dehydrorhamnose reductase